MFPRSLIFRSKFNSWLGIDPDKDTARPIPRMDVETSLLPSGKYRFVGEYPDPTQRFRYIREYKLIEPPKLENSTMNTTVIDVDDFLSELHQAQLTGDLTPQQQAIVALVGRVLPVTTCRCGAEVSEKFDTAIRAINNFLDDMYALVGQ